MINRTLGFLLACMALSGSGAGRAVAAMNDAAKDYAARVMKPGPYATTHAEPVWHDTARNRDVPVRIDAPAPAAGKGPFPVVVFSPGVGESRDSYAYLGRYWASHGYLVVTVNHAGSDRAAYDAQGWGALADPAVVLARPRDLSFAIDRLTDAALDEPLLRGRVDGARIAAAGHSLGSTTALALAGLVLHMPGAQTFTDPRVRAVIVMSPQLEGVGRLGLDEHSWDAIRTPTLVLLGSRDVGMAGPARSDPLARRRVFQRIPAGEKYLVELQGGEHHAFTETEPFYRAGPRDPRHHGWIAAAGTAFLDAVLRDSSAARYWLRRGALQTATQDAVIQQQGDNAAAPAMTAAPVSDAQRFMPVTRFIENTLREKGVSGAGMLIVDKQGHTLYERYFGDWNAHTVVPIASASKWFAAATVMTLVDEGLVKLDDRVERYLPEFRNKGKKSAITLRQTMSFTAGYPPHHSIEDDPNLTLAEVVRRISDMDLLRDPGTGFIYGGLQMEIAGRIAEVVTGKPYRTIFHERLVGPLGLADTRIATLRGRNPRDLVFDSANPLVPGGVVTDISDYRKFLLMLLNSGEYDGKRILSPAAIAEMTKDQTGDLPVVRLIQEDASYHYGLGGWVRAITAAPGEAIISSEGALGATPWIYRQAGYGAVFLVFAPPGQMREFGWRLKDLVTDILYGKAVTTPPVPQPVMRPDWTDSGAGGDALARLMSQADLDGDGQLSRDEVPQRLRKVRQYFDRIDRNGDGRLSMEELRAAIPAGRSGQMAQRTLPEVPAPAAGGAAITAQAAKHAYAAEQGPSAVATAETVTLHDARRNKDVIVRVTYPQTGGPFPVLLFSHYSGGSKDDYQPLVRYWVSHGYVCIQPNHSDSPQVGGSRGPSALQDWQNRPHDLSFLIDALDDLTAKVPALAGKLDKSRIGVGGHYFGAYAANLLAGMRVFPQTGAAPVSFADARVKAAVLLSPQGTGQGVTAESWAGVRTPLLVMTGSHDASTRTGNTPRWRTEPYQYSPPGGKYLIYVEGLSPGYGGISDAVPAAPAAGPANPAQVALTQNVTLAFWDAYLKGLVPAREYLRSGEVRDFSSGSAEISWK